MAEAALKQREDVKADTGLKQQLVDCIRMLEQSDIIDYNGHCSIRLGDNRMLINIGSCQRSKLTIADICTIDLDGNVIEGNGKPPLEFHLHAGIYKARPDGVSVVHSHSPSVIPFGLVDVPMQAMFHNAAFIAAGVPVFDIHAKFGATDMLVGNGPKGVALAEIMGSRDIVLMRAHGAVACGPTLQSAVFRAVYTEVNARIQHWTLALGGGAKMAALNAEEGRLADAVNRTAGQRAWDLWRGQVRSQVNW